MSRACALCRSKKSEKITLHAFPANKAIEARWRLACEFLESDCVKTLVLCSKHFKAEDYYDFGASHKKRLKPNTVPSIKVPYSENILPNVTQSQAGQKEIKGVKFKEEIIKLEIVTEDESMETIQSSQLKITELPLKLPRTTAFKSDAVAEEKVSVPGPRKIEKVEISTPDPVTLRPTERARNLVQKKNKGTEFKGEVIKLVVMTKDESAETIRSSQHKITDLPRKLPSTSTFENGTVADKIVSMSAPRKVEISTPDSATISPTERALYHAQYVQNQLRRKVKNLQQDKRRLTKRLSKLKEIVKELKSNALYK